MTPETKLRNIVDSFAKETWSKNNTAPMHQNPKNLENLEYMIAVGLREYQNIRNLDQSWSQLVQLGSTQFDPEIARYIHARYIWWFEPCDYVLGLIKDWENVDYPMSIKGVSIFRSNRLQVKAILMTDIEETITSMEQIKNGEVELLTEEDFPHNEVRYDDDCGPNFGGRNFDDERPRR